MIFIFLQNFVVGQQGKNKTRVFFNEKLEVAVIFQPSKQSRLKPQVAGFG